MESTWGDLFLFLGLLFFPVSSLLSFALCSSPSPPSHPHFRWSVCLSCSPCWLLRYLFLFLLLLFSELVWVTFLDPFSGYLRWVSFPILSPFWALVWGVDAVFYLLFYRWLTFPVGSWDQQHQFMKGILGPPTSTFLSQKLWRWGPAVMYFLSLPGDPGASKNLKVTTITWGWCGPGKLGWSWLGGPEPALSCEILWNILLNGPDPHQGVPHLWTLNHTFTWHAALEVSQL